MVTTIQLNENVKNLLDSMKKEKQTYEEVILSLVNQLEERKRNDESLLIEGCKEMYSDMKEMSNTWDNTLIDGLEINEEWNL